jgi:hypothetical protein
MFSKITKQHHNFGLLSGRPDEFVKKIDQIVVQPFYVIIITKSILLGKVAQNFGLFLSLLKKLPKAK